MDQSKKFSRHFVTRFSTLPPQAFYVAVASLVIDPDRIRASLCSYRPGAGKMVWTAHLLTDAALAVAQVQFDAEQYNSEEEQPYLRVVRGGGSANPPGWNLTEAWVRPLAGITSYRTQVQPILGHDWFATQVWLTFADVDQPVELPAQTWDEYEQERSDKFLTTLRESIPWLS